MITFAKNCNKNLKANQIQMAKTKINSVKSKYLKSTVV